MRVSLSWLKDFVHISQPPAEVGELLTMAGLEVEGLEHKGHDLTDVRVSKILGIKPHPRADRLSICDLAAGGQQVSVVCGATNIKTGDLVPLALPGTRLPDGTLIKESRIRGEVSHGMLLAEDEMGLTDDHSGIMILPDGLMPGQSVSEAMGLEDWIFEVSLTPNRIDCASVLGIAREIGALTGNPIIMPEIHLEEADTPIEDRVSVTMLDTHGCPRYTAGLVDHVKIGPAPLWMRYRLHASGVRAINNVVDITNYVLLELGQPLHAFDYHRLAGGEIVVKRARNFATFTTLDGQIRDLDNETLMICDGERAVALAGIMGGLNSEITPQSTTVLVESAYFDPLTIRRSSKRLSLSTEASYRFERGIDIEGVDHALRRSLMLIAQLAGGSISRGIIDCYPEPWSAPGITLRVDRANEILGTNLGGKEIVHHLSSLGMSVAEVHKNHMEVRPPSFRVDITREADLIEEVARLVGYDNIPVTIPAIRPTEVDTSESALRQRVKALFVGMGFSEVITYSFISPGSAEILGAGEHSSLRSFVRLQNPLSQDQSAMRTSLIPGLLSTAHLNASRGQNDLRIFEWGKVYLKGDGELPREKPMIAALLSGMIATQEWYQAPREVDFFDIKGVGESILEELGIEEPEFRRNRPKEGFDPDEYARISCCGSEIGAIGKVSKGATEGYGIQRAPYQLELDIEALSPFVQSVRRFKPLDRFPSVRRDISIIVNRSTETATLLAIVKELGKGLIESVHVFDVYRGKGIREDEKALAIRVDYRSRERTLTDEEVNGIHEGIIEEIRRRTGGRLREG